MRFERVLLYLFGVYNGVVLGARMVWPKTYHFKAVLTIPSANITEPYEVWADDKTGNYRFDFYNSTTKIYRKQNEKNVAVYYRVSPESTDSYQNKNVCHELSISTYAVRALLHIAYLPYSGYFTFDDTEVLNGKFTERWKFSQKSTEFDATYSHTVWIRFETVVIDNQYTGMPIRHDYRLLHKNKELDFMQHDYKEFYDYISDPSVFDMPNGLLCPAIMSTHINEAIDPILELVNPDLEHSRKSEVFESFKVKYNKQYENNDEHFMRLHVFKNNLRYIDSVNRQQSSYKLAVNHFSDMTDEELAIYRGTEISQEAINSLTAFIDDGEDGHGRLSTFDWRSHGAVTPVKDQTRLCGSCYAFSTAAAVESAAYVSRGCQHLDEVSEQAIIDCSWGTGAFGNNGCEGGKTDYSLSWIKRHGIPLRQDYGPYLAMAGYCKMDQPRHLIISDFQQSPRNVSFIKKMIRTYGPLVAAINTPKSAYFYQSGIYNDPLCSPELEKRTHSVLIVGYGKEDGQKYWIIKNTYGPQWGDGGYIKINMKDNLCGVANYATAVIFKKSQYKQCFV